MTLQTQTWRERLESHARACRGEDGTKISPADLSGANLRGADLSEADLRGADLSEADLRMADLRGANLRGGNLSEANLRGAYLRGAYLREANLYGADLRGADLSEADLRGANLIRIGPIGSRAAECYYHRLDKIITAGCFRGTAAEFRAALDKTHPVGQHRTDYLAMLAMLEAL